MATDPDSEWTSVFVGPGRSTVDGLARRALTGVTPRGFARDNHVGVAPSGLSAVAARLVHECNIRIRECGTRCKARSPNLPLVVYCDSSDLTPKPQVKPWRPRNPPDTCPPNPRIRDLHLGFSGSVYSRWRAARRGSRVGVRPRTPPRPASVILIR